MPYCSASVGVDKSAVFRHALHVAETVDVVEGDREVPREIASQDLYRFAGAYLLASMRPRRGVQLSRSRLGHWAGVLNYLCLGVVTGAIAWPDARWRIVLDVAGAATAALNLAAVGNRLIAAVARSGLSRSA